MLPGGLRAASDFALYCHAIEETGADGRGVRDLVSRVEVEGVGPALAGDGVPAPSPALPSTSSNTPMLMAWRRPSRAVFSNPSEIFKARGS